MLNFLLAFQRKVLEAFENLRRQVAVLTSAVAPNVGVNQSGVFPNKLPLQTETEVSTLENSIEGENFQAMVRAMEFLIKCEPMLVQLSSLCVCIFYIGPSTLNHIYSFLF
jgi:hypothetical protein